MTLPERMLWQTLRSRPQGLKFRRQHPLGPYVLDFYCPAAKLAVEVDGASHGMGANPDRDLRRDAWLSGQGLKVFRLKATDVMRDLEAAVTAILDEAVG